MNYEEAISEVQGNERYNIFMLLAFSIMACVLAMDINSIVFIGYIPSYECSDESFNRSNVIWIEPECHGNIPTVNGTYKPFQCTKWSFDKTVMNNTIATEFNLICEKKSYVAIMNTLYLTGMAIGYFISIYGDKIGRIRLIQICAVWEILINILLPFMTNIWLIFLMRFLVGLGSGKAYQAICYLTEIISVKKRSAYANNYWVLFVLGYMLIPGIAYGTRDWRLLRHYMNIPMVLYLIYFWIPESPRWLGVVGKKKEAQDNLLYIAKRNGQHFPSNKFDSLLIRVEDKESCSAIVGTRTMRIKTFVLILAHGTISVSYIGLSINESFISNNIFLNVFIQGSTELLTGPAAWLSTSKLNRKLSLLLFFITTSICLPINIFITDTTTTILVIKSVFAFLGKFTLNTAYIILDMYLNEVFPTPIRNKAIFTILGIAASFAVLAPTINELDKYVSLFSLTCYAIMCFIAAILIYWLLPETKGCPLPQTMEEGEMFRKGNEKNYCKMIYRNSNEIALMTNM